MNALSCPGALSTAEGKDRRPEEAGKGLLSEGDIGVQCAEQLMQQEAKKGILSR